MKKIILIVLISTFAFSGFFNESNGDTDKASKEENARLCQVFTMKAERYKKNMRDDEYAKKTLENYLAKARKFCSASKS